ncbi:MAG: hypothetical protein DLM73_01420 [Chthoniobacterales bacterium]|nr:MAG: hypothetical protein DLM73_01420 [Chthoniobacterales bacterium]
MAFIACPLTPPFYLEISMTSSRGGSARVFYDIGAGINARDSAQLALQSSPRTVYRFPLSQGEYRTLQFHPADGGNCEIAIQNVRIVDLFGHSVKGFSPTDIIAGSGVSQLEVAGSETRLSVGPGEKDPTLLLDPRRILSLRAAPAAVWLYGLRVFLFCFVPVSLAGIIWLRFAPQLWQKAQPRWERITAWSQRNPRRAIFVIAVISVLVSCYPVVFFGRSFVSGNVAPMLYPGAPTLPGHSDRRSENLKGSDAGAMMWHDVPNSFIQSRALARDGELPLWNRFNSCGLTLLGQGQSMFGDPLHMLVLAGGGEAWSWDIKFLLAKILFCFGLGLAVHTSSRHLPTALLFAFSSAFIGFFSYRFNHPAFFSVCYAPWLLLCWIEITRAPTARAGARWIAGLLLATWAELNSGTVKEAYMLLLSLHGCGLLIFLLSPTAHRTRKLINLGIVGAVFLLLAAPVWLTFFEALQKAYVPYKEAALAYQIQPGLLIGFFDDIFYRAVNPAGLVYNPSVNFLVLLGTILALIYFRRLLRDPVFVGISLGALLSFALIFGAVPPSLIEKIPMINHIWHIDNTFSCPLLIELFVLAGFGCRCFLERGARRRWKMDFVLITLALFALFGSYLGLTHSLQRIPNEFAPLGEANSRNAFFYLYSFSVASALLALPWLVRAIMRRSRFIFLAVPFALLCLVCLHWRHGFQLNTGVTQLDDYVVNPAPRLDLSAHSTALDSIASQPGVFRTVGFGNVLFPGVNGIPGVETIYGPDPLANPYYHELLASGGVKQEWNWRWIVERSTLKANLPLYSMLNLRFFLDMPENIRSPAASGNGPPLDLDVSKNEGMWPRAFFAEKIRRYDPVEQFLDMLRQADSHPFAAVQNAEGIGVPPDVFASDNANTIAAAPITPAYDYHLTNNTTTFTIDAPAPGAAVLTEAYVPGDFIVRINGAPANYFRVNHAFRGVNLPAAGKYVISYSYWPKHFTASLVMAGVGALLLGLWMTVTLRSPHAEALSSEGRKHP